jgi:myo-inositol-1(or 4)-monophosphatase
MIDNSLESACGTARNILGDVLAEVKSAAGFILDSKQGFHAGHVEFKGAGNLVSFVDRGAEKMLMEGLSKFLPHAGFLGEEGSKLNPDADYRWIVDPLDGTTNFMHGLPHYAISVALQFRGMTVLGVVEDIEARQTYHAVLGDGAWCGGKRLEVSQTGNLAHSLLCMGFPYPDGGFSLDAYMSVLRSFVQTTRGMRRLGAAALDLAWVASGKLDGFYEWGLQPWDVAAAALLIQEAGGCVSDFHGGDDYVFGRQLVASSPLLHSQMLSVIRPHFSNP